MFRVRALLAILLLTLGFTWGGEAQAWWNNDWSYRKEITLDLTPTGADVPGSVSDAPVLVRLSLGNFQYFADTKPDGSDLRFLAADDKTPLPFHIELFDPQSQIALVWVRVPRLTGGAKTDKILLYYGNKNAPPAANAAGTYDASQALVYHFGAPSGSAQDVTGYKTEPSAFTAEVNKASLIGAGVKLNGSQQISVPASGALRLVPSKGLTLSVWARIEAAQGGGQADVAQLSEQGRELVLGIAGTQAFVRYAGGNGAPVTVTQSEGLTTGQWHHLALRVGDHHLSLLVDGLPAGQADLDPEEIGGVLTIGSSAAKSDAFTGELDELEVSNVARSNDWLKLAARSQGMAAPLVVYGGDSQKEGGHESYFATTLRNVTSDGWVVIGILTFMFFASVAIMVTKALFLNRVAQGNSRFLESFYKEAADPAALERRMSKPGSTEDFGISTLAQLYHQGMQETLKRFEAQTLSAERVRTLSAQSIEAIRATMDAGLTRRLQQLNKSMVWLTVSIAGGPFLGLLGTVVGVMITFAAIAASGDVNINAIAPGIAAALVATVAGLGVAIPCLFGYNYLNTRIKEIGADMRVFVDEFVTRIAETYS